LSEQEQIEALLLEQMKKESEKGERDWEYEIEKCVMQQSMEEYYKSLREKRGGEKEKGL